MIPVRIHRRFTRGALVVVLAAAWVAMPFEAADATPGDLVCPDSMFTVEFSPGVKVGDPVQVTAHVAGDLATCAGTQVGTTGTSGELHANAEGQFSCGVTGSIEGQGTIAWSGPGQPLSVIDAKLSFEAAGTGVMLVLEGNVNSGALAGDMYRVAFVPTSDPLIACQSDEGLKEITGLAPIEFE